MIWADKKKDPDPKAIQLIEIVGQSKNADDIILMKHNLFTLMILQKIKETRLKFSHRSAAVLEKIGNYQEVGVKLTNTQLNNLKQHIGLHYLLTGIQVHTYSFGIEYIAQEVLNKIKDKSITHNIFTMQDDDSIMCGFYRIAFIEYMLGGKNLSDYINLFSSNDYKKKDQIRCKVKYGESRD